MPEPVPLPGLAPVLVALAATVALASALAFHGVARRRLTPRAALAGAACLSVLFFQAGPAAAIALLFLYAGLAAAERFLLRRSSRERRSARQVFANLGPAVALSAIPLLAVEGPALATLLGEGPEGSSRLRQIAFCAALAALGASLSDSLSSAAGRRHGRPGVFLLARTRALPGQQAVAGLSGQVTAVGTAAGAFSALAFAGLCAMATRLPVQRAFWFSVPAGIVFLSVAVGAFAGNLADSLLGEAAQFKGRCHSCGALTEETTHCGGAPERLRGVRALGNGGVNVAGSTVGGVVGGVIAAGLLLAWG